VQSSFYIPDGTTRTFPSTKHIASRQNAGVYLQRLEDDVWITANTSLYELVNNSIVFDDAVSSSVYKQIEIRVADTSDELEDSPSDISLVAGSIDDINMIADNLDLLRNSVNGEYIVAGLPETASLGDLGVNVLDGGIYEYNGTTWILVAQSSGGGGSIGGGDEGESSSTALVTVVDSLPTDGQTGEIFFNMADGFYYAYINGEMKQFSTPVPESTGIEVVDTTVGLAGAVGDVVYDSTLKKLMEYNGSSWIEVVQPIGAVAEIGDGTITEIKLAAGLTVIKNVSVLPTVDMAIGDVVYLTTDGKLYRYTASGWTAKVPTQDLTGTITETQIADDAISTPKLAAGAVTADTIGANAITSDKISANAIVAGKISAGVIGATEIASNAITSTKIAAGAITADKIAANSISAANIQAGAITSDKLTANSVYAGAIQAGAITSTKLAANSVLATSIAAGAVTASKIAAYSIDATKIAAGAITADKISTGTASLGTGSFSLGTGTSVSGYGAIGAFTTTSNSKFGIIAASTTGNQAALAAGIIGSNYSAGFYNNPSSLSSPYRTSAYLAGGTNAALFNSTARGTVLICSANFGFEMSGSASIAGNLNVHGTISNFTGTHYAIISEPCDIGDVVSVVDTLSINVSETYSRVAVANTVKDKNVFGVVSYISSDTEKDVKTLLYTIDTDAKITENAKVAYILKPKYSALMELIQTGNYTLVKCNALGEGMIMVCSENGNIESGDYICSASIAGRGMKQDDDLLHNYTVAKALESVDWSKETSTTKMIACTYHAG
jgi:hypothetical protein